MAQGVTIFRPETCVIDAQVEVGADTVIEPYVQLLGATKIGVGCRVRSYSVVQNSVLGDGVMVRNGCCTRRGAGERWCSAGALCASASGEQDWRGRAYRQLRGDEEGELGKGSKANHLNYLGDAVIGAGVNIGAGAITCNYDGVHKHQTTIGDGVFVGSDSTLVAPVTIENGAYIAAGSCITHNVPAGSLALGRSRQVTKPGWVAAKAIARSKPC